MVANVGYTALAVDVGAGGELDDELQPAKARANAQEPTTSRTSKRKLMPPYRERDASKF
jgi:hypothetical protein